MKRDDSWIWFGSSLLVLSMWASPLNAKNWADGTGNWNVPGNWSPAAVPTAGEAVNIVNTDGTVRTVTLDISPPSLGLVSIDLSGAGAAANTLSITSNVSLTSNALFVGGYSGSAATAGRGAVVQSAGAVAMVGGTDLAVAYGAGSTGTYTLSGTGTFTAPQSEFIGYGGSGTFNQSGGTNTINAGAIGSFNAGTLAGAIGTYNLSAGQLLSNKSEYIGDAGTGIFNQTGGTNTISGSNSLYLGNAASATGTYTASGSAVLNVGGNANVGVSGAGTLNVQGSALVNITSALNVGANDQLNVSGGTLRLNSLSEGFGSVINYTAGTIQLGGSRVIGSDTTVIQFFATSNFIPTNKGLAVEGVLDVNANTTVNGGKLQALSNSLRIGALTGNSVTTLTINNGGTVTAAGNSIVGMNSTSAGVINVDGLGSSFSAPFNLQLGNLGNGLLYISNGGTVATDSGTLGSASNAFGSATLSGTGSKWNLTTNMTIGVAAGPTSTLDIQTGSTARIGGQLTINATGVVTINGGTLGLNTLSDPGNKLQFNTGTIQLAGNRNLNTDPVVSRFFGGSIPTIGPGRNLTVEGTASVSAGLSIQGGTLRANSLSVSAPFQFSGGVLEMTGGSLSLPNGQVAVPTGGEFRALGTISQRIAGAAGSTITATGNLTLGAPANFDGFYTDGIFSVGSNAVTLSDFNDAVFDSGSIMSIGASTSIPGSVSAANGLTLDFGGNFVGYGTITTPNNIAKPLINNGHIMGLSAGAPITLPGYVKGVGTFDQVVFTGTYSPGLSPTTVTAGSLAFASTNTLIMELGGTTPGSSYDEIQASGALVLGGTLQVSLINGFTPAAGQSFDLLDWGSISGTFSSINLPALTGLTWNTSQLYTTGVLSVASAGLAGDYNQNGVVDAADYVVLRKGLGTIYTQNDFNIWRANFGASLGAGTAVTSLGSAVPEPSSAVLIGIAAFGWPVFRRASQNSNR